MGFLFFILLTSPLFSDISHVPSEYSTIQEGSPCIDAGIIIDGLDYYGSAPDMGAHEWTPDLGDLNADGILDIVDVVAMVNTIIALTYDPLGDMNNDGIVDIIDIIALINIILDN